MSDYLGKSVNKEIGKFYSMKNKMGGEVFVSTQGIVQSDISKVVSQTKGKINIISGRHGDYWDNVILEPQFYLEDIEKFGGMPNVNVFDFSNISSKEIESLINSEDTTILGWCFSECFTLMKEAFK